MHVPKLWQHSPVSRDAAQQLESQLRVSSFLANLLVQRGIDCSGDAESFLNPALRGRLIPYCSLTLSKLETEFCMPYVKMRRFIFSEIMMSMV